MADMKRATCVLALLGLPSAAGVTLRQPEETPARDTDPHFHGWAQDQAEAQEAAKQRAMDKGKSRTTPKGEAMGSEVYVPFDPFLSPAERHALYCKSYPGLCKAGCVDGITPEESQELVAGQIAPDGRANLKPWCSDLRLALKYDRCWQASGRGNMNDFKDYVSEAYEKIKGTEVDDNGYCYWSGACEDTGLSEKTTLEQMEKVCEQRFEKKWHAAPPQFYQSIYDPTSIKFRSATEANRTSQLYCAVGIYHCAIQECKTTYCKDPAYIDFYSHHKVHKKNKDVDEETTGDEPPNPLLHEEPEIAARGFFTWDTFDGAHADCSSEDESDYCYDNALKCTTEGVPSSFEQLLWTTHKAATPDNHPNLRVLCAHSTQRVAFALTTRSLHYSTANYKMLERAEFRRGRAKDLLTRQLYAFAASMDEFLLQDVVKFCTTNNLCHADIPHTSVDVEKACDTMYGRHNWTSVSIKTKAPKEDYYRMLGMQSCATNLLRYDMLMCQEIVCWNEDLRCDEEFCQGKTQAGEDITTTEWWEDDSVGRSRESTTPEVPVDPVFHLPMPSVPEGGGWKDPEKISVGKNGELGIPEEGDFGYVPPTK